MEAQIEKLFEGQPKGFPFDDFEVDDIMLPDGDDMDIPSDDDDAADEEEIQAESGFGSVIGAAPAPPHSSRRLAHDHASAGPSAMRRRQRAGLSSRGCAAC